MADIINFPRGKTAKPRLVQRPAVVEEDPGVRSERNYKFQCWKTNVRNWGGGHRRADGLDGINRSAIATFTIHKREWENPAYRSLMGAMVFQLLVEHDRIVCEPSRVSDRVITRCLNKHVNFRRFDGAPVHPPRWLLEEIRLLAMDRWREQVEREEG